MSSSDHRKSVSPSERQRAKSRSSSRTHRTPSDKNVSEDDAQREKTPSQTSKRMTREKNPTKRSESSASNRSTTGASPTLKRQKSTVKTRTKSKSKSPTSTRKTSSKRNKSAVSISDADSKQLSQPNDSQRQDLSARGLSVVPTQIFELTTLRQLIVSNNNLSDLPTNIRSLVNLEYLDMSRNPLRVKNGLDDYSCLPREFRYLKNLRTLIMAECTLKHVPAAVWQAVSLQTLDISRNKVGFIVSEIGNLTDIRHLRLSQMDLDTLPPEIGFCDKLQTIDLTGNPIDNLPETLVECRLLYELKINYRTFYKLLDNYMLQLIDEGKIRSEHIPQVIFELENLHILDLNETKLNSIPNENTLLNLNELYLSNNSFFDIPESICTMEQLKILDMSHNRLQNIPEHFVKIKRLETLILSYNNLTILPKIFTRISTLKRLNVSHNQLTTIEDGFAQNRSLLTLDISYNNLKSIPDEICDLELLETLDLRYNQLEYLPLTIRRMIGLKSMNTFAEDFQRIGLHLIGNSITDPPSYIWKSTNIQTLFDYIETKEKILSKYFCHLKLILIGPKNIGKTTFTIKLLNERKITSNTRKTLDMYVSSLQEKQFKSNEQNIDQQQQQILSARTSSVITDQWIENRISTSGDHLLNRISNVKRIYPPPLKTYRSNELLENIFDKSTFITKNNFYCTIFDLKSEPVFEIIYPLIYDSNALFVLPVNLTTLLNIVQAATSLENMNENDNQLRNIHFDALLTYDWLYCHIFRYIESISDHCEEASIAVIGLIMDCQIASNDQQQQLLDEIHSKVTVFLNDEGDQRKNIRLYSEVFPQPIHLDDEQMSSVIIEQLETIAQQWNFIHHKQKCEILKRRLGFIQQDSLIIDYATCLTRFEQHDQSSISSDGEDEENSELIENEINQMNFDECLDYLKLTGDILCFGSIPYMTIIIKPYFLLNNILSRTLFRPRIAQWLNYDDNLIFHFSGYYPTQEIFDIDRQRLLTRGEYTWRMLNVLFCEHNNNSISLNEQNIIDYCRLMEQLYLGYLNESNLNYQEFTTLSFVCPWLMNEQSGDIDYIDYFKSLEQKRQYEQLQCERARRIKQQQLWFAMDDEQQRTNSEIKINIEELPSIDRIEIFDSQIINQDLIQRIKIINKNSNFLPNGLYERLVICLHPLFNERLDYYNITLGRTTEKNLIKIERSDTQNEIHITINNCLFERIENILIYNLFSFYPTINLQIET